LLNLEKKIVIIFELKMLKLSGIIIADFSVSQNTVGMSIGLEIGAAVVEK